ncbi:MAG: TrbC/VirB2 family protein [Clostridia bacterium]|nr:TrbC/VirB2 family protein [Clostridia bacterium]
MRKQVKVITTILMVIAVLFTISNFVFGASTIAQLSNVGTISGASGITNLGKQIVGILQIVGAIIAVVVLTVLGIKYMMGSAEEKAEYKKTMIPYVIGAILVFAATTIANVIVNIASGMASAVSA